jgi:hypothetical protein
MHENSKTPEWLRKRAADSQLADVSQPLRTKKALIQLMQKSGWRLVSIEKPNSSNQIKHSEPQIPATID